MTAGQVKQLYYQQKKNYKCKYRKIVDFYCLGKDHYG
jgi:hypothetical protein